MIAEALEQRPLEPGMVNINGSGLAVLSVPVLAIGSSVAIHTENAAVSETDPTSSGSEFTVGGIAGQVDASRQLVELSRPAMDRVIADDLSRALAAALDVQIVSGSGAAGQMDGLANVSGILTASGAAASTVQLQVCEVWDAWVAAAGSSGFGVQDGDDYLVLVSPARLAYWSGGSGDSVSGEPRLPGRLIASAVADADVDWSRGRS